MKILVIQLGGFAEVLLSTPLIRCLQQQFYTAEVHVLTAPEHEHAIEHNRFVRKVLYWHHDIDMQQTLEQEDFSHIIDLQNNPQSRIQYRKTNATVYRMDQRKLQHFLYNSFRINLFGSEHWVDRAFATAGKLNVLNDGMGLNFTIPATSETKPSDIPTSHHMGFIAIHLSQKTKTAVVRELCRQLQHPVILTGNFHEQRTAQELATVDAVKVYNACGKFSFYEMTDLWQKAKLIITADSGVSQITAALQKPIVLLNGTKQIATGQAPYHGNRWGEKKMFITKLQALQPLLTCVQTFLQTGKLV